MILRNYAHFRSYYLFMVLATDYTNHVNSSYQLLALTIRDCSLIGCGQQGLPSLDQFASRAGASGASFSANSQPLIAITDRIGKLS